MFKHHKSATDRIRYGPRSCFHSLEATLILLLHTSSPPLFRPSIILFKQVVPLRICELDPSHWKMGSRIQPLPWASFLTLHWALARQHWKVLWDSQTQVQSSWVSVLSHRGTCVFRKRPHRAVGNLCCFQIWPSSTVKSESNYRTRAMFSWKEFCITSAHALAPPGQLTKVGSQPSCQETSRIRIS